MTLILAFAVRCCACYLTADHRVARHRWVINGKNLEAFIAEMERDRGSDAPLHIECERVIEWVHPDGQDRE